MERTDDEVSGASIRGSAGPAKNRDIRREKTGQISRSKNRLSHVSSTHVNSPLATADAGSLVTPKSSGTDR